MKYVNTVIGYQDSNKNIFLFHCTTEIAFILKNCQNKNIQALALYIECLRIDY